MAGELQNALTDEAMNLARQLVGAWSEGVIDQVFVATFRRFHNDESKSHYTRIDYHAGIATTNNITSLALGPLRELHLNGLIHINETGLYGTFDGLRAEVTLLKPLQTAVGKNFG